MECSCAFDARGTSNVIRFRDLVVSSFFPAQAFTSRVACGEVHIYIYSVLASSIFYLKIILATFFVFRRGYGKN